MHTLRRTIPACLIATALLTTAACGAENKPANEPGGDKVKVVTAFYPLEYVAQRVAGDKAEISNLTAAGADAHGVELTPKQVASLTEADLVVYIKGFSHNIDKAIEEAKPKKVVDATQLVTLIANEEGHEEEGHDHEAEKGHEEEGHEEEGHEAEAKTTPAASASADEHDHEGEDEHAHEEEGHEGHNHGPNDPHIWLDPTNMGKIAEGVQKELTGIDAANAETFKTNAQAVVSDMAQLDESFKTGLKTCDRKEFITSHEAFGYLAHRYGLEQIGIAGLSTEDEPSPARIAEVQKLAKEHGVTTIFHETQVSAAHSEAIAGDLKLKTDVLDPVATLSDKAKGKDYLEIMKANLAALKTANGCK